ncbi:MAG: sulfite exporter TauE/SafE family protein [Bacteroidetes bacterium]|nr:sulfite exporter TauE/SafE family protein [Bacteroidota bacterium]
MGPETPLLWTAIGAGVGLLGAMLGIGGGLFVSPLLLHHYEHIAKLDSTHVAPLATATSLLSVWATSLSGTLGHARQRNVAFREALSAALSGAITSWTVARFITTQPWYRPEVPRLVLVSLFALLLLRMLFEGRSFRSSDRAFLGWVSPLVGVAAGMLSALVGVGGGVVMVPLWHYWGGMEMRRAAGTSMAAILPISTVALITYAVRGWGLSGLPPHSLGYVDYGTALPLLVGGILGAPLGSRLASRISPIWLRRIFALVALGMIGYLLAS